MSSDEERRRALAADLDARNARMLARVKDSGLRVRPAFVDRISRPRAFNNGRKQTI